MNIKCCAITISGLYVLGLPLFHFIAKKVDPPIGLMGPSKFINGPAPLVQKQKGLPEQPHLQHKHPLVKCNIS
jgi:hypothetical protein